MSAVLDASALLAFLFSRALLEVQVNYLGLLADTFLHLQLWHG